MEGEDWIMAAKDLPYRGIPLYAKITPAKI